MKFIKILFIFYSGIIFSQKYIPIDTADKSERDLAVSAFKKSNKQYIESIKKQYSGKEGKLMVKEYEGFFKDFEEEIKKGTFCFDSRFIDYSNQMLANLRKDNPLIPNNTQILISKDPSLNAYCLPDGTFVLNMGLFYWLSNDDQLAAVVSHELSHKILEHSLKKQLYLIKNELSSKSKGEAKNIKKQKYNKSRIAFDLIKNKLYATGELSKKNEYSADSLGVILVKASSYNQGAFIEALQLMAKYDTLKPKGLNIGTYKKVFNLPNQSFRDEWLNIEGFSQYDYSLYKEKLNKDSLSSHPELKNRIDRLKKDFPELEKKSKKSISSTALKNLQGIAKNEQVPSMYFFEEYGLGIYLCLIHLQENIKDIYYKEWLGKCFEKIYEGRKNYQLNRYLERVDPKKQSESYQQFLNFMWNLSLDEIKNITDYYTQKASS